MKINATVIQNLTGRDFDDKQPRIRLRLTEAAPFCNEVIVPNTDLYDLDDELVVLVMTRYAATELSRAMDEAGFDLRPEPVGKLAYQLRPDPPAPFLADSARGRCGVLCHKADDVYGTDHECLYYADEEHSHTFSASCQFEAGGATTISSD